MKNMTVYIFVGILFSYLLHSCKKNCDESERGMNNIKTPMLISSTSTLFNQTDTAIYLGDTLKLSIEIPFENIDLQDNEAINIRSSSISDFGIDYLLIDTFVQLNNLTLFGLDKFDIKEVKGSARNQTQVAKRCEFSKELSSFRFEAIIIPLAKGLVKFANYGARGKMNGGCVSNDFVPVCINTQNNHYNYYRVGSKFTASGSGNNNSIPKNHYYIWVK